MILDHLQGNGAVRTISRLWGGHQAIRKI